MDPHRQTSPSFTVVQACDLHSTDISQLHALGRSALNNCILDHFVRERVSVLEKHRVQTRFLCLATTSYEDVLTPGLFHLEKAEP